MSKHRKYTSKGFGIAAAIALIASGLTAMVAAPSTAAAPVPSCNASDSPVSLTFLSDPTFQVSSRSGYDANYLGYKVTNKLTSSTLNKLWVKISMPPSAVIQLDNDSNPQPNKLFAGTVAPGDAKNVYFLAKATSLVENLNQQPHTVDVYDGNPEFGGMKVCEFGGKFDRVVDTITANSNKVTTIEVLSPSGAVISSDTAEFPTGSSVRVVVKGDTGTIGSGPSFDPGVVSLSPVPRSNFASGAWRLTEVQLSFDGSPDVLKDSLYYQNQNGKSRGKYTATYRFKATGDETPAYQIVPIQYIASGTQLKHTGTLPNTATYFPAITNGLSTAKSYNTTDVAELNGTGSQALGGVVRYSVTISNSENEIATIDDITDLLPAYTSYTGDATGDVTGAPVILESSSVDVGDTILFPGPFDIPANGSISFSYSVYVQPGQAGQFTNLASANLGSTRVTGSATFSQGLSSPVVTGEFKEGPKGTTHTFDVSDNYTSLLAVTIDLVDPSDSADFGTSVTTADGTWTLNRATRVATFIPASANFTGVAVITLKVTNMIGSASASLTVYAYEPPVSQNVTRTIEYNADPFAVAPTTTLNVPSPLPAGAIGNQIAAGTTQISLSSDGGWVSVDDSIDINDASGKGTWRVLGDASVQFTRTGTNGTAMIYYRIADRWGQYSNVVTITVNIGSAPPPPQPPAPQLPPVVEPASADTVGTNPVNILPVVRGVNIQWALACLIDPIDNACKQTVTIAGKGTWTILENRQVRFVAQKGYVGCSTVKYQATDSTGLKDEEDFQVCVKEVPILRVMTVVSNFPPGLPQLRKGMKAKIKRWVEANPGFANVKCIGVTMGPYVKPEDFALSKNRAINSCNYIKKLLGDDITVTRVRGIQELATGNNIRRVIVTMFNNG